MPWWNVHTVKDDSGEFSRKIEGAKGYCEHLQIRIADITVNLDVRTPVVVDVQTYSSAPFLTRALHPVCLTDGKVVQVHLGVQDRSGQPGLSQGYDAGFIVGSLHQAFSMEHINLVSE